MKKKCTECGKIKPLDQFCKRKWRNNAPRSACYLCYRVRAATRKHKLNARYSNYKSAAKRKGRVFYITTEEFQEITDQLCIYCNGYTNIYNDRPFCGIDRIDPNKGYIKGNINPCCYTCNIMKQSLTHDEFTNHIKRIMTNLSYKEE